MFRNLTLLSKFARNPNFSFTTFSERFFHVEETQLEDVGNDFQSEVLYTVRNVDECASLRCFYNAGEETINFEFSDFGTKVKLFQGCDDFEQYYTISGKEDIDLFRNCLIEDLDLENEIEDWVEMKSTEEDFLMEMIVDKFSDPCVFLDSWLNSNNIPYKDRWHANYFTKIHDLTSLGS